MCQHYRKVTFWCSESCPLFGVSFNGGSTVLLELYNTLHMYKCIGYCTCIYLY